MKQFLKCGVAAAASVVAMQASAVLINFDALPINSVLSNQYAGVTFSPNAFSGAGGPTHDWASNTDMTIVDASGTNVGAPLGLPLLVGGNLLHGFNGWMQENGDPSFRVSFASAINAFSADFAGVSTPADVKLYAYDGTTFLGSVAGTFSGQFTLSYASSRITSVVVTPGSFDDWVGVDNINYTLAPVPEPETLALMGLGLGVLGFVRRRARNKA